MKTTRFITVLAALLLSMSAMCQISKFDAGLQKQIARDAKKMAKQMEKEGWKTTGLPLERQLVRYYECVYDLDENENPNYFFGNGQSKAQNYDASKMQSTTIARLEILHSMEAEATSLVESMVGNEQLGEDDATSLATMIAEGKLFSSKNLGRTIVVVEAYRDLPNKNKEVLTRVIKKASDVQEAAKNGIREEMKKRGKEFSEKTWNELKKN